MEHPSAGGGKHLRNTQHMLPSPHPPQLPGSAQNKVVWDRTSLLRGMVEARVPIEEPSLTLLCPQAPQPSELPGMGFWAPPPTLHPASSPTS